MDIVHILLVAVVAFTTNIFLGRWRVGYRKFTVKWWVLIHASIPLIIPLRLWLGTPVICAPLFIGLAIAGQFAGSKWGRVRKSAHRKNETLS